jgi:hypothetical protein
LVQTHLFDYTYLCDASQRCIEPQRYAKYLL